MPILSELSRRFHMLTTDAKPDPPRIPIDDESSSRSISDRGTTKCANDAPTSSPSPSPSPVVAAPHTDADVDADADVDTSCRCADFSYRRGSSKNSGAGTKPNSKAKSKSQRRPRGVNVIKYNVINSHKVNIGSRTSYICNVNSYRPDDHRHRDATTPSPTTRTVQPVLPDDVKLLASCVDEINSRDICVVKTHMGHGWRDVARRLSYSDGQIDQFEENYRYKGVDEIIYQLLLDWKRTNTSRATVGMLSNVLWTCREYDCVRRWIAARNGTSR